MAKPIGRLLRTPVLSHIDQVAGAARRHPLLHHVLNVSHADSRPDGLPGVSHGRNANATRGSGISCGLSLTAHDRTCLNVRIRLHMWHMSPSGCIIDCDCLTYPAFSAVWFMSYAECVLYGAHQIFQWYVDGLMSLEKHSSLEAFPRECSCVRSDSGEAYSGTRLITQTSRRPFDVNPVGMPTYIHT